MDNAISAHWALTYTAWILLQLLRAPQAVYLPPPLEEEEGSDAVGEILNQLGQRLDDLHAHI